MMMFGYQFRCEAKDKFILFLLKIIPANPILFYSSLRFYFLSLVLVILIYATYYFLQRRKERARKLNERKIYLQLYEAMEALVHICRDGCRTIGPHDKVLKVDQGPCNYESCKALELLVRHFAGCKMRVPGGCIHCKRMWQLLELHSHLCPDSDVCRVPLCRSIL